MDSTKNLLREYLKILDDDIKGYKPRKVAIGKENALASLILETVKGDIEQILNGESVKKYN